MADLKLGTDGDLELDDNNDLIFVEGLEAIAQDVSVRLRTYLGEWFLDTRQGLPYFQRILGEKPRIGVLKALFGEAILLTPGISSFTNLDVVYNSTSRGLSVGFRAPTDEGILDYSQEFILP